MDQLKVIDGYFTIMRFTCVALQDWLWKNDSKLPVFVQWHDWSDEN